MAAGQFEFGDVDAVGIHNRKAADGGTVMAVIQVAMHADLPYTVLRDLFSAHPTMAEGLNDWFAKLE